MLYQVQKYLSTMFSYFESQRHFETFLKSSQSDVHAVWRAETLASFKSSKSGKSERITPLYLACVALDRAIDDYFRKTRLSDYEHVAVHIIDLAKYRAGVVIKEFLIYHRVLNQIEADKLK